MKAFCETCNMIVDAETPNNAENFCSQCKTPIEYPDDELVKEEATNYHRQNHEED